MGEPLLEPDRNPPRRKRRFWLAAIATLFVAGWIVLAVFLFKQSGVPDATGSASRATAGASGPFVSSESSWLDQPPEPTATWEPPGIEQLEGEDVVAARHDHVAQSSARLQELAAAHRDALAAMAKALADNPNLPPNPLWEQLETERQLVESQLAGKEILAERIALLQQWVARLDQLEAQISPNASNSDGDQRDMLACRAASAGAAVQLARERYRDQLLLVEVLIQEDLVAHLYQLFKEVDALFMVGAPGGESYNWSMAGYELSGARAKLAKACGDRPMALKQLRKQCEFGAELVGAYGINMGGPPAWTPADIARARASLATARTELLNYARLLGDQSQVDWVKGGHSR